MDTKQPTMMTDIQNNCCSAMGITCNENLRVTDIIWSSLGLDGVLNSTYLPTALSWLDLSNNILTGSINKLPNSLTYLNISSNEVSGPFPILPSSLSILDLSRNLLSCDMKSVEWPASLVELYINNLGCSGDVSVLPNTLQKLVLGKAGDSSKLNRFTGTLHIANPIVLQINDNWITDVQISNPSLMTSCDISNTPLLGNPISNFTICSKIGIFGDGQSFGCTTTEPTAYYRYQCGLLHVYLNTAIAYSWSSDWQSKVVIDCTNVPVGIDMAPNVVEGQSIKCSQPGATIYRYTCGKFRAYPSPQIAASWDPNWATYQTYDCVGLSSGPSMSLKGPNDNGTTCVFNYCPITNSSATASKVSQTTSPIRQMTSIQGPNPPPVSKQSAASQLSLHFVFFVFLFEI